jgi:integrase
MRDGTWIPGQRQRMRQLAPGTWNQALAGVLGASTGRPDDGPGHPVIEIAIYPDVVWLAARSLRELNTSYREASRSVPCQQTFLSVNEFARPASCVSRVRGQAVEDWLRDGLQGRAEKTITLNRDVLKAVVDRIGRKAMRELTAQDVRRTLTEIAATRSTRTVVVAHNALERAIRHAEANDYVRRNVASLVRPPSGQPGRPSKSLTLDQANALLAAAEGSPLGAYVVLCLLTGVRTEEVRALTWERVDLDGNRAADPPVPSHVAVWRSVRAHGDTKTQKSKRTLRLPERAVAALREHLTQQADQRLLAGDLWQDHDLVFCTSVGTPLDAANVRRTFKKVTTAAGLGENWTPRELRTSFVSLMSDSGVPVEEIAGLVGHTSSRTTEVVYRRELRPVIATDAEVMDKIFSA